MFAIYKKELRSYFINPVGYVYVGVYLTVAALLCCYTTIISGTYNVGNYFVYMIFALIILIPLLTMRLFSEERKLRTEQLLLTAPVTLTGMVLGKFFAALSLYAATLLVSCVNFIPLYAIAVDERSGQTNNLTRIGPVTGELVGCLISLLLIGAAFIAIGTFICRRRGHHRRHRRYGRHRRAEQLHQRVLDPHRPVLGVGAQPVRKLHERAVRFRRHPLLCVAVVRIPVPARAGVRQAALELRRVL